MASLTDVVDLDTGEVIDIVECRSATAARADDRRRFGPDGRRIRRAVIAHGDARPLALPAARDLHAIEVLFCAGWSTKPAVHD
ncbi:MAG: hypothetical protein S0880_35130 [Actinomycetota bacterium]|nr:hypothetical protein [Actinomycetota bacterium]